MPICRHIIFFSGASISKFSFIKRIMTKKDLLMFVCAICILVGLGFAFSYGIEQKDINRDLLLLDGEENYELLSSSTVIGFIAETSRDVVKINSK